jgi:hypothetical protein
LPKLFQAHQVTSVLDAPCGDFNWMASVLKSLPNINYTGGDIVEPLIAENRSKFESERIKFIQLDITRDKLPEADLMIVRDCLIHLSFSDMLLFFKNFCASNIKFLLVGSHNSNAHGVNKQIKTGEHRYVDLFQAPINFQQQPIYRFDDFITPQPFQEQCLFRKQQIQESVKHFTL